MFVTGVDVLLQPAVSEVCFKVGIMGNSHGGQMRKSKSGKGEVVVTFCNEKDGQSQDCLAFAEASFIKLSFIDFAGSYARKFNFPQASDPAIL